MKNKKSGFTLIELLVVIAIIGILSSVVLASLNSARRKSRDARRVSDIKQLQLALELYFDSNGSYPAQAGAAGLQLLVDDGYISTLPTDPVSGNYNYAYYPAIPTYYHLGATLEEDTNAALNSDKDCNSVLGTNCPYSGGAYTGGGFDGTGDGLVYDVTP